MEETLKEKLKNILGDKNLSFKIEDRLCYSRDVTPISYKWIRLFKRPPFLCDCVIRPKKREEILKIFKISNSNKIPLTVFGGGSGTVGGIFPLNEGIVIDMGNFNRIVEFDEKSQLITVEAGMVGDELERFLNCKGYTLRHFPQSFRSATIGGLIATRSTGQFSTKYGNIEHLLKSIEVILPNGNVIKTQNVPRSSTGPDLNNLFIGSEGILGIIISATLKFFKIPEEVKYKCYLVDNFFDGIESIRNILQLGIKPAVVRFYNKEESILKFNTLGLDISGCLLILCFEGKESIVDVEMIEADNICKNNNLKCIGEELGLRWYENRYDTKRIMEFNEMEGGISDAIEVSANWSKINSLYQEIEKYFENKKIKVANHISHIYQEGASIYYIFYIKCHSEKEAIKVFFKTWKDVLNLTMKNGGSISHHHGIGIIKREMLKKQLKYGYELIHAIKESIDPEGILNKGKLIK